MKLVYYHPIAINDPHPFQKVVNPLISVLDRTNNPWPNWGYLNQYPMPGIESSAPDFMETAVKRINQLVAGDGAIAVLWSGGIDSTFILTLMISCGILSDLKNQGRLTIGLNTESIKENPEFYNKFLKTDYIDTLVQADQILSTPERWSTIITGEMADNLVGSLTMKSCVDYYNDFSIVHQPWGKAVDWLGRNLDSGEIGTLRDFISGVVANSPVEIVTNHDLLWYLNFNFKWQAVNYRIVSHAKNAAIGNMLITKLAHFFNTPEFQQWSMQIGHHFTSNTWRDYKLPLKKQILDVTGDQDYFNYKTKYPSLPGLLRYKDTFDFIYLDETSNRYIFSKEWLNQ